MVRHLCVVGNYRDHLYPQGVVYLVVLQNQDAQSQDAVLTFQGARQLNQQGVVVDAELRRQLKMDYYQDAVDAERYLFQLNQRLKMDYYQDEGLSVLSLLLPPFAQPLAKVGLALPELVLLRALLLTRQDQRRVRRQVRRQVLD